jgi:hypothetical protein
MHARLTKVIARHLADNTEKLPYGPGAKGESYNVGAYEPFAAELATVVLREMRLPSREMLRAATDPKSGAAFHEAADDEEEALKCWLAAVRNAWSEGDF